MGQLIDGVWHDTRYDTKSSGEISAFSVGFPQLAYR